MSEPTTEALAPETERELRSAIRAAQRGDRLAFALWAEFGKGDPEDTGRVRPLDPDHPYWTQAADRLRDDARATTPAGLREAALRMLRAWDAMVIAQLEHGAPNPLDEWGPLADAVGVLRETAAPADHAGHADKFRCGKCGDWLWPADIAGHGFAEGRDLRPALESR